MTRQYDLLDYLDRYPDGPGYKAAGTSMDSAAKVAPRAPRLRNAILGLLGKGWKLTPDEAAHALGESILSIRPRFSELVATGQIMPTGDTRPNASGHRAQVYKLVGVI